MLCTIAACLATSAIHAGELSAIVNGKSYHSGALENWNENNYGFGLEYEFSSSSRWKTKLMANSFIDSTENMSHMAGAGLHRRLWESSSLHGAYADVGINAFLMTREDVDSSRPFPGALPSLTLGNRYIGVNLTWMPRKAVEEMYGTEDVDEGISSIFFLQLKVSTAIFLDGS